MTINKIKISMHLQSRYKNIIPEIGISIDDILIGRRHLNQLDDPFVIDTALMSGRHILSIDFNDHAALTKDPHIVVEIKSVKFQHLPDEFNIYSCYRPIYPDHWVKENLAQGRVLDPVIHSNHIGWCGRWWIDFETPIYPWIHEKLNLGWFL